MRRSHVQIHGQNLGVGAELIHLWQHDICGKMCVAKQIWQDVRYLWHCCENPVCPDPIWKPDVRAPYSEAPSCLTNYRRGIHMVRYPTRKFCEPRTAQLLPKFCGESRRPSFVHSRNDRQVLRRFAETTNPRKNCADQYQDPVSSNSMYPTWHLRAIANQTKEQLNKHVQNKSDFQFFVVGGTLLANAAWGKPPYEGMRP